MEEGMAPPARYFVPLFPPLPVPKALAHRRRSKGRIPVAAEKLSLELTLAPPCGDSKNISGYLRPPSPVPMAAQVASSSDPGGLSLELWLWPPSGPSTASLTQTTEEGKKIPITVGSIDTAHSGTRRPGRDEDEVQSRSRWGQEEEERDPSPWEEKVRAIMNGMAGPPVRVLEKKLYATDVSAAHSRLLLAENMEEAAFCHRKGPALLLNLLTDAEKAAATGEVGGGGGLPVLLLDRQGREYPAAKLRLWRSSESYVLLGNWTNLVRQNELDPGDVIDVYFFRPGGGGGGVADVGLVVCPRVSAYEEKRRHGDDPVGRKRRRKEKGDQMRAYKRRLLL